MIQMQKSVSRNLIKPQESFFDC